LAIDARHDGSFLLRATLRGMSARGRLEAQIRTAEGEAVGASFAAEAAAGESAVLLETRLEAPRSWSAESPYLYRVELRLSRSGRLLHRRTQRFGFRTVEVRPGDGLFVNGHRVLLKGVNRHAFWPPSGRTLNRDLDFRDARLIKAMNMNAVRSSHYPPDPTFLDACDELGIYVLDELAGWHDAYSTAIGRRLVRETVERDVNHPSILFWTNGNEGGWNTALDEVFGEHDVQRRPVLHPAEVAAGIDTDHYPTFAELEQSLDPSSWQNRWRGLFGELPLVMPTELLHGLYDGGSAAGLEDYWRRLRGSSRAAGGFLWSFSDEAVVRTDRDGLLDSDGNHAPDGILGPYRETTGSYHAVRELFSPIVVGERILGEDFDGALEVENRYDMTDLSACRFAWALVELPGPGDPEPAVRELGGGELPGPRLGPGERGRLVVPLPPDWHAADGLRVTARDPFDREVGSWFLPVGPRRRWVRTFTAAGAGSVEVVEEDDATLRLAAGATEVRFDRRTGELALLRRDEQSLSFGRGLGPASGTAAVPIATRHYREGAGYRFDVRYREGLELAHWKLFPSGWLRLSYQYSAVGSRDYLGIGFPYPEEKVLRFEWLGDGPARVWKNRLGGGMLGVWEKQAADSTPAHSPNEPKLRGYYGDVYWARLRTTEGELTLVFESDGLFLGLFSPAFPEDARDAVAAVPPAGITFLNGISPIGTKFHAADQLGPQSQPHAGSGQERGTIWLFLGEPGV
ncbi:MAG: glycoside hydrolase family 2, partial [bacterium]|nr:glycoside hydrolase family 2 [bacterium]